MSDENDPLGFLDAMGDLPEFKDGYWSRQVAAAGALQELAGLRGERGDVEPIDQQFLRFAQCVAAAYDGLDDEEIIGAKETPELMRYLVKALGGYAARATSPANLDAGGKIKTAGRYRVLAEVFLASGGHGGPRKGSSRGVWTQKRIETAVEAYLNFLFEHAEWDYRERQEFLFIPVVVRVGYEISNLWRESDGAQLWFPIPGADLRAPVTWSVLPGRA